MKMRSLLLRSIALGLGLLPLAATSPVSLNAAEPAANKEIPMFHRLSPSQYRQTIADVFGPTISITGRFEPELRQNGLLAIGAGQVSVTDTGLERYDDIARGIAGQVVDARHRETFVHCTPRAANASDDACAREFLSRTGRLLYRRALTEPEVERQVKVAAQSADTLKDFYAGLSTSLAEMLISPDFLFRFRTTEPDPAHPGQRRLTGTAKASVISYLLWNSAPDDALLVAAESGALHTDEGLRRQVDRMISSPRIENGVRGFFADMLGFNDFDTLAKDPTFYPRFTLDAKDDSQEQTLRTIVDHIVVRQGDYRDLFTTPRTYLTRSLAALYGIPLPDKTDNGQPMRWQPYTYADGDPRAGLLAHASFLSLHSPAGRSSPTARGKALREALMCQHVPAPPAAVDFSIVQQIDNPQMKTARARLTAHSENPVCAGCHKITDPIGLALENFDGAGGFRTTENGVQIDASGEIGRVKFDGPAGLAQAVRNDPAIVTCVSQRVFGFGAGRQPPARDPKWTAITDRFQASNYNVVELFRQVALSDLLYDVSAQ